MTRTAAAVVGGCGLGIPRQAGQGQFQCTSLSSKLAKYWVTRVSFLGRMTSGRVCMYVCVCVTQSAVRTCIYALLLADACVMQYAYELASHVVRY